MITLDKLPDQSILNSFQIIHILNDRELWQCLVNIPHTITSINKSVTRNSSNHRLSFSIRLPNWTFAQSGFCGTSSLPYFLFYLIIIKHTQNWHHDENVQNIFLQNVCPDIQEIYPSVLARRLITLKVKTSPEKNVRKSIQ